MPTKDKLGFAVYIITVKTRDQVDVVVRTLKNLDRHDGITVCPITPAELCELADEYRAGDITEIWREKIQ